ncbi:MAG: methylase domain protein [Chloroflexi bacterium]|nr:methylase domain protein [Chloroflexota bacterium]
MTAKLVLNSGDLLKLSPVATPQKIRVNRRNLLDELAYLKTVEPVNLLRDCILELRQKLFNPNGGLLIPAGNFELSEEMSLDYLLEELEQIAGAFTLDRARYYLNRLEKGLTKVRTGLINDINLNRWKEYRDINTDSLWILDRRDNSGVHTAQYWGNFVPQIPSQLMKRYTKKGDWVLDTFSGLGTTMIESQRLGRNGLGIELQAATAARSTALLEAEPNLHNVTNRVVVGDSAHLDYRRTLEDAGAKSAQLLIMHPPYYDIIKFSDDDADLSNAPSLESFLEMMGRVIDGAGEVLDRGRYLALVIGDKFSKGEWIPLGFMTMNEVQKRGFQLKSIIVKNFEHTAGKRNQQELWKYRALLGGFYIFKHEYIFLFKKN